MMPDGDGLVRVFHLDGYAFNAGTNPILASAPASVPASTTGLGEPNAEVAGTNTQDRPARPQFQRPGAGSRPVPSLTRSTAIATHAGGLGAEAHRQRAFELFRPANAGSRPVQHRAGAAPVPRRPAPASGHTAAPKRASKVEFELRVWRCVISAPFPRGLGPRELAFRAEGTPMAVSSVFITEHDQPRVADMTGKEFLEWIHMTDLSRHRC